MIDILKNKVIKKLAAPHVAGPLLDHAIECYERVRPKGWRLSLSPWKYPGEAPNTLVTEYRKSLLALGAHRYEGQLCLKPADLEYRRGTINELATLAASHDVGFQFDAQDPAGTDPSFSLLAEARGLYDHVGCTIPARWSRSRRDAESALRLGVSVRVVKGQWLETQDNGTDANQSFLALIQILAGRARHVSVATHDEALAAEALDILQSSGTACELELMLGLPHSTSKIADKRGVPVRLYVPYGCPYLPYRISDVRHRPAIAGWMIRDFFGRNQWNQGTQ